MNVWVGTSGYAYKQWKGPFYPQDLSDREMLSYYAGKLNSVEINNTFYRMPSAKLLDGWAEQVPSRFSFVLKASRRITHFKKLRDVKDDVDYLFETASRLGERLGPILFQLPPYLKKDSTLLRDFLALVPEGSKTALEFRSSSWFDDEIYGLLLDRGVALVAADAGKEELPAVVARTAPHGYARLRQESYTPKALSQWVQRLSEPGWEDLYVFFKHEDAGAGPKLAGVFSDLMDVENR
jgi:uncharacterized protein YecE (DUF72 family)